MNVAYLSSVATHPGSPDRRDDAFEHDLMMDNLRPAFDAAGDRILDVRWDDPTARWAEFDAVIIGTTWDYWDRHAEFLATLDHIADRTNLHNPPEVVRWNGHKRYLRELAERGVPSIHTVWADRADAAVLDAARRELRSDDLVVKRQVGAGAEGQVRLAPGDAVPELVHPMMIQPFLPSIGAEGELSFVFVDGEYSHGIRKRPAGGDYRIQSLYGGTEEPLSPERDELAAATEVVRAAAADLLYARVDMVRDPDGALVLMELELVEPFLYPVQGPELGTRLQRALARRSAG